MNTERNDQVVQLYLDDIIPNRFQPREVFDEKALKELAVSIKEHGVIQPIIVRNVKGKYEIIAGERRYKASALAGMTKIPAIIRDLDDKESSKVALLENLQRKNLTPIEEARTYQKILEIDEMTQEELAKTMGKSQSAVANKLRLLSLPDAVQDSLLKEQISERHARALLNIPDSKKQIDMLKKIISTKMSVRTLEEEIKKLYPKEDSEELEEDEKKQVLISTPELPPIEIPSSSKEAPVYPQKSIEVLNKTEDNSRSEDFTKRFINFNEIDEKEDEKSMDINDISRKNLPRPRPAAIADLDGLLNINNPSFGPSNGKISLNDKYDTPGEQIVKNDSLLTNTKELAADYFRPTIDEQSLPKIPTSIIQKPGMVYANIPTDLTASKQKIRDLVAELKASGLSVSLDEMNFEKTYQVIIKIDK